MNQDYLKYLEEVKNKLDRMNKASGFDPEFNKTIQSELNQSSMPSNDIFDMLGNGAKLWMEKNKNLNNNSESL